MQTNDLTKIKLQELTDQQINSRIHLLMDYNNEILNEVAVNNKAIEALQMELIRRKD